MTDSKRDEAPRNPERKRPYTPPAIEDTAVFETLALTCGKITGVPSCQYSGGYSSS